MNILVTGANGFIGKNLIVTLETIRDTQNKTTLMSNDMQIYQYDVDSEISSLDDYCKNSDFIFHLAGVNRPVKQEEFMEGNFNFTSLLLDTLKKQKNKCPVMISSSIQASMDNPYGLSKKAGEDLMFSYAKETGADVLVYRFPNVFGKWCRPNYNSAVATFCHNIANDLPVLINDRNHLMTLVYIDDVITEMINALYGHGAVDGMYYHVPVEYKITLGEIVDILYSFKAIRDNINIPDTGDAFTKKLYATYLTYLPLDKLSYPLNMNVDDRGSFTEIIRTVDRGQFSVNISKPGVIKGNHWHHTKNEKFLVVSGKGVIRLRKIDRPDVAEYYTSGNKLKIIDIPPGYTHNIENIGETDMTTFIWCSECFDPEQPDTIYLDV